MHSFIWRGCSHVQFKSTQIPRDYGRIAGEKEYWNERAEIQTVNFLGTSEGQREGVAGSSPSGPCSENHTAPEMPASCPDSFTQRNPAILKSMISTGLRFSRELRTSPVSPIARMRVMILQLVSAYHHHHHHYYYPFTAHFPHWVVGSPLRAQATIILFTTPGPSRAAVTQAGTDQHLQMEGAAVGRKVINF